MLEIELRSLYVWISNFPMPITIKEVSKIYIPDYEYARESCVVLKDDEKVSAALAFDKNVQGSDMVSVSTLK